MPLKRRRDEDDNDDENDGQIISGQNTPRSSKRNKTNGSSIARSSAARAKPASLDVYDFDMNEEHQNGTIADDSDEDDLAASQVIQVTAKSTPRNRIAAQKSPAKTRTPRKTKSITDTPSKSTARRKTDKGIQAVDINDEEDPAANLILQIAGQDAEDEEEDEDEFSIASDDEEAKNGRSNGNALQGGFEAYFEQAARKQKTSNNTLSKLPALPQNEYLKIIKSYELPYADAAQALYDAHVKAFPEWSFEVDQGYSICLSGYGSKKTLIQGFCAMQASEYGDAYVVINGYHPNIDLRQICSSITTGLEATGADVDAVMGALDDMKYERLILAIHNIDGPNLRSERVQSQLARLLSHVAIRLICSIDHVHAPLLFSANRSHELRLLFHDATTFLPYTMETELQPDSLSSSVKTALVGDRGIKWILQTLSQNARTIFRILLLEQIETGLGMETTRLFEKASAAFAVSNKTAYNAQMGEFLDHEIIVTERGQESNTEVMRIPFTKSELQRLLEDIDSGDASDDAS